MGLGEGEALNCLQSCPCPFIPSWAPEPFLGAKMLAGCCPISSLPTSSRGACVALRGPASSVSCFIRSLVRVVGPGEASGQDP